VRAGHTLFIAGLARIDFIEGAKPIRFTVFTASGVPVTVVETQNADEVYNKVCSVWLYISYVFSHFHHLLN